MYTKPVGEFIKRYNIKYHCYADDTKVYMTLTPCDKWDDISSSIEACIADISNWMNSNMLKLNKDKREFFVGSSKQHVKKTENLRNLGLILDSTIGMEKQVNYICKSCYYQIRTI